MKRRNFISAIGLLPFLATGKNSEIRGAFLPDYSDTRNYWIDLAFKLGNPVLDALSKGELRVKMPVETIAGHEDERRKVSHLEAFGRLMSGLAPWFQLAESQMDLNERTIRNSLLDLYFKAIANAVNPYSPDQMNFTEGHQPLVDAAFLIHALIKAPILYENLDDAIKKNLLTSILSTRIIEPGLSNWLMFSAIREVFLLSIGADYLKEPIDFALNKHSDWYKGDGVYGDGPSFHWDYYNSYVIHPMLLDVLKIASQKTSMKTEMLQLEITRAQRYSEILERLIAPDGSFPPIGRSLAYRAGAFQLLAQLALNHQLPGSLAPGQVRSALSAVIRRTMEPVNTFDKNGWLRPGLCGFQPGIAETYISTGSLYLCATALLPLGLPPVDPFWSEPATQWTSRKIWQGENIGTDHAISS